MKNRKVFDEVKIRWDDWSKAAFPSGASDMEINGTHLIEIDTFSARCIRVFVGNQGKLDQERIDILRNCTRDLDEVVDQLSGNIKDYFIQLSELSHRVLESVG